MARFNCRVVFELRVEQIFGVDAERMQDAPEAAVEKARVLLAPAPPGLEWYVAEMDIKDEGSAAEYHMSAKPQTLP